MAQTKRVFKTKKKVSGGGGKFRAWDNWDEGDTLIAKYIGEGRQDKYGNPTYRFQIEEVMFSDKKALKEYPGGSEVTLNHTGGFGKSMEDVAEDDMLQITYNGKAEIQKGKWAGTMAHAIEVLIVEEDDGSSIEEDETEETEEEDYDI